MKISNWCILFSVLFCGMILYTDLRFRYTMEAQYTMEEYNTLLENMKNGTVTVDATVLEADAIVNAGLENLSIIYE